MSDDQNENGKFFAYSPPTSEMLGLFNLGTLKQICPILVQHAAKPFNVFIHSSKTMHAQTCVSQSTS